MTQDFWLAPQEYREYPTMDRRNASREASDMTAEKVALITAGGSGMGADAARRLAADGFRIGVLSSSGKGESLAEELGGFGVTGSNLVPDDLARLVDGAMARWGRVDVLVNSAGHGPKGAILDISDEDWHLGLDVYLMNVIRPTRLVTPIMAAQGGGAIINISTFAVFEPDPLFPTSGVFRAGLASFAKLFADRYAGDNIRMNNVLPGFIDSLPETQDRRARIPLGRYGRAEEVSSLIGWLASDAGGYVTGQNWRIDGGLTRAV
jgi:NAD(P)-dependent dehydrogenase (short-subunit alcohol dehydrogenase family)